MSTHNQCFRAKIRKKHHNFSSENYTFYNREKLQYITWACFRKELGPAIIRVLSTDGQICPLGEPRDAKTMTHGTDLSIRTSHSCQILIFHGRNLDSLNLYTRMRQFISNLNYYSVTVYT